MTKDIQKAICVLEVLKFNIPCENVKYLISDFEFDVASLNKSSFISEFEVKISRSDFKADFKKRKMQYYSKLMLQVMPNYFWYVCPESLIQVSEIPKYAGLMYYKEGQLFIIKNAVRIHRNKFDRIKTLNKFLTITTERMYLGNCRMTYQNNLIKERNQKILT